jgi:hypothetical protein
MAFREYGSYDGMGLAELVRKKAAQRQGIAVRGDRPISSGGPPRTRAALEEQIAASLRVNRQNSALFESEKCNSAPMAEFSFPLIALFPEAEILSQSDPTDNALAAIASILDQPESHRDPEKPAAEEKPIAPGLIEADGYSKVGPGPMEAIRFKWSVRREDNGEYYVDETIGENSTPIVSGPMSGDAAVEFVDDRESEARQRFEQLKSEMIGRGAAANLVRKDGGEM